MIQSEKLAEFDFSQEDTLVLGATDGFGFDLALDLKIRGVRNLALGSRSLVNYKLTEGRFDDAGVDTEGLVPFIADLGKLRQVQRAAKELPFRPKHVFLLPATGMPFAQQFGNYVFKLQEIQNYPDRYEEGAREETLAELHEQYDVWLPKYLRQSLIMNVNAPVQATEVLLKRFPEGFTLNTLDSLFADEGRGPRCYTDVLTKHQLDIYLAQNARAYRRRGVDIANVKAAAILGTQVGDFLVDEVAPVENKEVGDMLIDTAVESGDIFGSYYEFMLMNREERATRGPILEPYIFRHGGELFVTESFPEELRIDPDKYEL